MKIKVIIKKSNQKYQITEIENKLENLQEIVEGLIEAPYIPGLTEKGITTFVNEEGKILNLKPSIALTQNDEILDLIHGNVLFASVDEEGETIGLNEEQIEIITKHLNNSKKLVIMQKTEMFVLDTIQF